MLLNACLSSRSGEMIGQALAGLAGRAHVTGFGVPEHHGSSAISTSTSG